MNNDTNALFSCDALVLLERLPLKQLGWHTLTHLGTPVPVLIQLTFRQFKSVVISTPLTYPRLFNRCAAFFPTLEAFLFTGQRFHLWMSDW